MKYLKLTLVVFASYVFSFSAVAAKQNLLSDAVTVAVYNADTQSPQTNFNVGDTVGYTVEALLPASADSKEANIEITLSVKIHGIDLPFKLSQKIDAPITGIDKTTGTATGIPKAYEPVSRSGTFVIPDQVSGDTVTINAKVSIKGAGSITKQQSISVN